MESADLGELSRLLSWLPGALLKHAGGDQKHTPLFRSFPEGIPEDTNGLWWNRVLVHFLQGQEQPCVTCGRAGTTHVLKPCAHIVCDHCFDGSNYSACPVCGHRADATSPFFREAPDRGLPKETVTYKLLDVGEDVDAEARAFFGGLCSRSQALSPQDRAALNAVIVAYQLSVLDWLPAEIPLRENIATVFGGLLRVCPPGTVMPRARPHLTTATDVLRLVAVMSGTDGSLQTETVIRPVSFLDHPGRFWGTIAKLLRAQSPGPAARTAYVPIKLNRFKVAKLSRALRRELLSVLESMRPDPVIEDMLRHRSYWVWLGEFLHPHEYAKRFPNTARAFEVIRQKAPDGALAPKIRTWYGEVEQAMAARDTRELVSLLSKRPGEFGRRLDRALRTAPSEAESRVVSDAFTSLVPHLATPMLATLLKHLPSRAAVAPVRFYWPKGKIAKGASTVDARPTIGSERTAPVVDAIKVELLARFGRQRNFDTCLIDDELRQVMAPFNERTASNAAISLPRGSRISVPRGKIVRLFLHWCQPQKGGSRTDLDLSVAFYDSQWRYVGVCSYYGLKLQVEERLVAQSSGDLTSAPWPDGATEFVDLHTDAALKAGARYAVMVVNAYSGMPFSMLERGFAGLMLREDAGGQYFDPRTVELRFSLEGENGIFMPLVLDFEHDILHWLDVQSKGQFAMNNVATSSATLSRVCPELISYFGAGLRPSMYDLALLHGASRCRRVIVRGDSVTEFIRRDGESVASFHDRMLKGDGTLRPDLRLDARPMLALLFRGDIALPEGSDIYALFREQLAPTLSAGDLISSRL
jgi:hypothetical protein